MILLHQKQATKDIRDEHGKTYHIEILGLQDAEIEDIVQKEAI